jgi:hypothetical protein
MTKDDYLQRLKQDPWSLDVDGVFPPDDWLADAWELENVRESHVSDMARIVSKMGELLYTDACLSALGRSLSVERQVELFNHIRGRSPHREVEFRGRFEPFFPQSKSSLPPPLHWREAAAAIGAPFDEYSFQRIPAAAFAQLRLGDQSGFEGGERITIQCGADYAIHRVFTRLGGSLRFAIAGELPVEGNYENQASVLNNTLTIHLSYQPFFELVLQSGYKLLLDSIYARSHRPASRFDPDDW